MCDTAINRRNICRVVRDEAITGRDIARCAAQIAQRLGRPEGAAAVEEILDHLMRERHIALRDATLSILSEEERRVVLERSKEGVRRQRRARRRAAARRTAPSARVVEGAKDPDWDPSIPTLAEEEYGFWCACTVRPHSSIGGWAEFSPATPSWDRRLLDACVPSEAHA